MKGFLQIKPSIKFNFSSAGLIENLKLASDGLKTGAGKLAERILKDL